MEMWTVKIRDQTVHSVQSNPDLHYPQKLLVSSMEAKELSPLTKQHNFRLAQVESINFAHKK